MGNFSDVLHISYEVTVSIIHCNMHLCQLSEKQVRYLTKYEKAS